MLILILILVLIITVESIIVLKYINREQELTRKRMQLIEACSCKYEVSRGRFEWDCYLHGRVNKDNEPRRWNDIKEGKLLP